MTTREFRDLCKGDEIFAHGNGYAKVDWVFMTGNAYENKVYVDLRLENEDRITAISEEYAFMLELA